MLGLVVLAGCAGDALEVRLPAPAGTYAPSRLEVEGPVGALAEVERCATCHAQEAADWSKSAHAHASFDNPWYRHSVDVLRDEVGNTASNHCAGCHDPVLLVEGRMEQPVDPADPLARLGVTCLMCHGARAVTSDGTASLVVDLRDLSVDDVDAHAARMLPDALREGRVCAGCHRGLLGPETGNDSVLVGMDDQGGWKGSAWAGSDAAVLPPSPPARATCVDCHVPDHRFPGAHTPLAAATGALDGVQEQLRGAATVLIGAAWVAGRPVPPEQVSAPVEAIDVVVWNTGTGHRFPGGTLDLQDTWLEVVLTDAEGLVLASSGAEAGDPDAARLKAVVVDREGQPETTHRTAHIAALAVDRTVPAGLARATRFVLPARSEVANVSVRLLHRRHPEAMAAAACAATLPTTLDGCAVQPITVVDDDAVALGRGAASYDRAWAHALALTLEVQERLDDARPSAAEALRLAGDDREAAAAHWLEARIAGRAGRLGDALAAADEAERRLGEHPAIWRARGEAHAQVWGWPAAVDAFERVAALAPGDTAAWRDLARARGSVGDPLGALTAAARGLALQPRDPDLLRTQALALRDLADPRAAAAMEAWLAHRPRDDAADLRMRCDLEVERCARDRDPVPEILQMTSDSSGRPPAVLALHTQMLLGVLVGATAGAGAHALLGDDPALAAAITWVARPIGQIFLRLLFMLVLPMVFSALALGIAELGDLGKLGRIGLKTLAYTVVVSAIAVGIGVLAVNLFRPGEGLPDDVRAVLLSGAAERAVAITGAPPPKSGLDLLIGIVPDNVVRAGAENDMLALMFFAVMTGVGLVRVRTPAAEKVKELLEGIYAIAMDLVGLVIRLAPLGVAALLFALTAELGAAVLVQLGSFVLVVLGALLFHQVVVYSLAVSLLGGMSPARFFSGSREAMLTAFSTASSSATLPTTLRVADELGLPSRVSRFVLTVGATANQNGTALFEGVTVLFLAQFYGVDLSLAQQFLVAGVCVLGGIGTAGVPAGSLPVVVMILGMVGVPAEGIGLVLGVDRFLDMCRTTLNVTGDLAAAVVISRGESEAAQVA